MSNFVIEHESDASEIKHNLKELASKGFDFPQSLRKVGISLMDWDLMINSNNGEDKEFLQAWLDGKSEDERYLGLPH